MHRLQLLGDFAVLRDGAPLALPQSRKTRALLAYLAVTGRALHRERLCEMFWDGPNDPKAELRWSLSKIRQTFGDEAGRYIEADRNTVRFPPGRFASDWADVQVLAEADLAAEGTDRLERAAQLFGGPFLGDVALPRCPDYEFWRTALAEDCRLLNVRIIRALIDRSHENPERALRWAHALRALLADEPDAGIGVESLIRTAQAGAVADAAAPAAAPPETRAAENPPETPLRPAPDTRGPTGRAAQADRPPPISVLAAIAGVRTVASAYVAEVMLPPSHFDAVDAEIAEEELARLRRTIADVVARHGGVVASEVAGEIAAVFGAPESSEDHAARACAAALDAQATLHALTDGAAGLRAGVDSGETITKLVPGRGRPEIAGPPLRGARLLMRSLGRPIAAATGRACRLTGARIRFADFGEGDLAPSLGGEDVGGAPAGEATTGDAARRIDREDQALSRWEQRARQGLSRFTGREAEFAILWRAAEGARLGRGRAVGVMGDPGLGKSRLTHEILDRAVEAGFAALESAPAEWEALVPYRALKRLLWSWLGLAESTDGAVTAAALAERVSAPGAPDGLADPLHWVLDLPPPGSRWARLEAWERAANIREAVRRLVAHEARLRPLVLLIEDMHWVDAESEAVIAALVEQVAELPLLLLLTFRPEYAERDVLGRLTRITLDPLDPAETKALAGHLLGGDESLEPVERLILGRADGVPLFLEELVHELAAAGTLVGAPGRYRCVEAPDRLAVPAGLRAVIGARIDRLEPAARGILQIAAVIGTEVPEALLLAVSGVSIEDLAAGTRTLRAGKFIHERQSFPSVVYAFDHALIWDVAYASMLLETRRALHETVLRALEADPARAEEDVEALAEHALRANAWEAAQRWCVQAADRAVERSAYAAAVRFLDGAAEALDRLPRTPERLALAVDVRTRMRPAYEASGRFQPALRRLEEAGEIATALGDDHRRMQVLLHHSYAYSSYGRAEPAIDLAAKLSVLARSASHARYAAEADLARAQGLAQRYDAAAMVSLLEPHRGAFVTEWCRDRFGLLGTRSVFFFGYLSFAYGFLGRFEEAEESGREAVSTARETGRPIDRCAALYYSSHWRLLSRPDAGLVDDLRQGARDCRLALRSPFYPCLLARLAQAQLALAAFEGAAETIARLDEAAGAFAMENCGVQARALAAIAAAGRRERGAAEGLASALAIVRRAGDPWMDILVLRARASLGGEEAESCVREALAVAETSGLIAEIAPCRELLARLADSGSVGAPSKSSTVA